MAHLPVVDYSTQEAPRFYNKDRPGHNKVDTAGLFCLRKPEFSRYAPPEEVSDQYVAATYDDLNFWILKDCKFARWEKLSLRK